MKTTIGFRTVAIFALTLCIATGAMAQKGRKHFSHEEFQAKQKEYITEKAGLTQEEVNAFFPIFFELQKKKFDLQQNAHKDINRKSGEFPLFPWNEIYWEILFGHTQFVDLQSVHAICHIDTTIRTFLYEVCRLLHIGVVGYLGGCTTCVADIARTTCCTFALWDK